MKRKYWCSVGVCMCVTMIAPVCAQVESTASTGFMGYNNHATSGSNYGASRRTGTNAVGGLKSTSSSRPVAGGGKAPGNLALKQFNGKQTLPPTRLNSFVRQGGDAVFGGDGDYLPRFNTFTPDHRIERAMEQNPNLTTNHKIGSPSAWDFPE